MLMPPSCTPLLLALAAGFSACGSSRTTMNADARISIGRSYRLHSTSFAAEREVNVWVPPSYSEGESRYPTLYVVDGGVDQDFHHISGLAQLATINGEFAEMIVVGVRTENRMFELTHVPSDVRFVDHMPPSGGAERFLHHLRDEVIPFVTERFRTSDRRALVGESLAGLFVTEVFLSHPTAFTDYVAVSPSLWWDSQTLALAASDRLREHDDEVRRFYVTMADEGGTMQSGLDSLVASLEQCAPAGLRWKHVDRRETHTHATIYHGAVHDALDWMFGLPPLDYGEAPWYLIEGAQPESK